MRDHYLAELLAWMLYRAPSFEALHARRAERDRARFLGRALRRRRALTTVGPQTNSESRIP